MSKYVYQRSFVVLVDRLAHPSEALSSFGLVRPLPRGCEDIRPELSVEKNFSLAGDSLGFLRRASTLPNRACLTQFTSRSQTRFSAGLTEPKVTELSRGLYVEDTRKRHVSAKKIARWRPSIQLDTLQILSHRKSNYQPTHQTLRSCRGPERYPLLDTLCRIMSLHPGCRTEVSCP